MKIKKIKLLTMMPMLFFLISCQFMEEVENKARKINKYETTALLLAKENRELKTEIDKIVFENKNLKSQIEFLEMKIKSNKKTKSPILGRTPSSVDFQTYKWSSSELLAMAQVFFDKKEYLKASDYFYTYLIQYPNDEKISDQILFQAGIASYKSNKKENLKRTVFHLSSLIEKYPNSTFYRGAKLWLALSKEKLGDAKFFHETLEEFRKNYRNTKEWEILSAHYETISRKYNK